MRPKHTTRTFTNDRIRNRMHDLQKRFVLTDPCRQTIHNEIESAARFWFIQGGGTAADFEKQFNNGK